MTSAFILCAGNGDRWNNYLGVPKQLISFGRETIIERTERLVAENTSVRVYCVAREHRTWIARCETLYINQSDSIAETISATSGYWSGRNVFLLGDVFFSAHAISKLFGCEKRIAFLGRPWPNSLVRCGHGEMFAMTFSEEASDDVIRLLNRGIALRSRGGVANLWNLYQLASGLPLGSSRRVPRYLMSIDDFTNDIDTPIDYSRRGQLYKRISIEGAQSAPLSLRFASMPDHYIKKMRWRLSSDRRTSPEGPQLAGDSVVVGPGLRSSKR
jgi:hypothetical protein